MFLSAGDTRDQQITLLEGENERLRQRVSQLEQQLSDQERPPTSPAGHLSEEVGVPSVSLAHEADVDEWMAKAAAEVGVDASSLSLRQCLRCSWTEAPPGLFPALVLRAALIGERVDCDLLLRGARETNELSLLRWLAGHCAAHTERCRDLLHTACAGGCLAMVKQLVQRGADVRGTNDDGEAPLHLACGGGHLVVVKWLAQHGAASDVSELDKHGNSPLHKACSRGHVDLVQWLVQHGAASIVSRANNHGETPLHWACLQGHLAVVKVLVQHGASSDVRRPNNHGDTPLFKACRGGHLALAQWLHGHGAAEDVNKRNNDGDAPLHEACLEGHLPIMQWRGGHLAVVQQLMQHGAARDVRRPNFDGWTPLHGACFGGHLALVQWLVQNGAAGDVSVKNSNGWTPLHLAALEGRLAVVQWLALVQWLYKHGAGEDVNRPDHNGCTPLHWACYTGGIEVAQWLLLTGGPSLLEDARVQEELQRSTLRHHLLTSIRDALDRCHKLNLVLFGMTVRSGTPHLSKLDCEAGLRALVGAFTGSALGLRGSDHLQGAARTLEELS